MMSAFLVLLGCAIVSNLVLVYHNALMHREFGELRREVRKCLRILYDAIVVDPEDGDQNG